MSGAEVLQQYYQWAEVQEQKVLDFMDPSGSYKFHPGAHYPLANFASVFAICVGYLFFVIFGTVSWYRFISSFLG
jgi:hypothetical protein